MPADLLPRLVLAPAPDAGAADALAAAVGVPSAIAALLVQRGVATPEAARAFLRPTLDALRDPHALRGMDDAVAVIAGAVRAGTPILVHGDYDVDGQCSTAILTRALRAAGARVTPFVPHRLRDGYDFGDAGLAAAQAAGAGLVVTCDCGISAVDAVARARALGLRVVVTDHHLPGPVLPPADAVVDPQQPGDTSGARELCGAGIAWHLVRGLVPALGLPPNLPYHLLDLAALATVADVVPLVGDNRILVRHGLRLLAEGRWPGLRALVAVTGLGGKPLRAGHLGFMLGPRLNAAGRLDDAKLGLRLLLADDDATASALARRLDGLNRERQQLDQAMLDGVLRAIEATGDLPPAIVLGEQGWHPGVVGIVASRVVERYGRPAFLVAFDGALGKGSGRSISAFDLHGALTACGDLLERYGGHRMAAGLTVRADRFADFRARFTAVAAERLAPDVLGPEQRADLVVPLGDLTDDLERLLRHLEPCGAGNPAPVFLVRGVRVEQPQAVGSGHVRARLVGDGHAVEAIGFGLADQLPAWPTAGAACAVRLERDEYRGRSTLTARLLAVAAA